MDPALLSVVVPQVDGDADGTARNKKEQVPLLLEEDQP